MKILNCCVDWVDAKNKCRTTVGKKYTDNEPSSQFKLSLLISEHSPIRLFRVMWRWDKIKYWLSTEFSRHHIGWEKWISTQRNDRTGKNRDKAPQDALVSMDVEANAQSLINVARYRLCFCAHPEAQEKMAELKKELDETQPELAFVMQKNCVYRCGCPEFSPCGWWDGFKRRNPDVDMTIITSRYLAADKEFYAKP